MNSFRNQLASLIKSKGLSNDDFIKKSGISGNTFYTMELESMKVETLLKICKVLQVQPGYFLDETPVSKAKLILEIEVSTDDLQKLNINTALKKALKK